MQIYRNRQDNTQKKKQVNKYKNKSTCEEMYRETTYKQFYTYKCTYYRCAYIYKLFLCVYCNGDKNTALCLFSKWRPTHILTFAFCLKQAEKACNLPSSECEKEQTLNMYIHMHTCVYTYIRMHVLLYPTLSLSAVNRRDGLFLCSVLYFTMSCISPLLAIVDVFRLTFPCISIPPPIQHTRIQHQK